MEAVGAWGFLSNRVGLLFGVKLDHSLWPSQNDGGTGRGCLGVGRHTTAPLILFAFPGLGLPVEGHRVAIYSPQEANTTLTWGVCSVKAKCHLFIHLRF
jgi:hypothetical protein